MAGFETNCPVVLIPARMAASRLPGKPLADIAGKPLIAHVWECALKAQLGPVAVATDSDEIASIIEERGGSAIMTDLHHASGSDRIFEALHKMEGHERFDRVLNLQGDLPAIDPQALRACLIALKEPQVDIATLGAEITLEEEKSSPNAVKIVGTPVSPSRLRALYFTRARAPFGEGPFYHHIGVYAYHRRALEKFIALPPSALEKREKLEQLRALEAGMRIDVAILDAAPLEVNTPEDLKKARKAYALPTKE